MRKAEFTRNRLFLKMLVGQRRITAEEQRRVNRIWLKIFGKKVKFTSCGSCLRDRVWILVQEFLTDQEIQDRKDKIRKIKESRKRKL